MKTKLAAQLYTLRSELQKDFVGVLHEVKAMGWAGVQVSGYFDCPVETIAETIRKLELGVAGLHMSFDRLRNDLDAVLKEAALLGTRDLVCPGPPQDYRNEEGYRRLKRELNEIAAIIEPQGFRLSYHNHAFEFDVEVDGQAALDYVLDPADGNKILAEVDVYWVKKGQRDPAEYIRAFSNRMPIIHLKDMAKEEPHSFAEIGTGLIDFRPILQWGEQNGIEWYAVEQDVCPGNPLDSLRLSYTNLVGIIDGMSKA